MGCSTEKLGSFDRAYKESMTNERVNSLFSIEEMECRIVRDFISLVRILYDVNWCDEKFIRIFKSVSLGKVLEFNDITIVSIDHAAFLFDRKESLLEDEDSLPAST